MNLEGRINRLESAMEKPGIRSWVDLMKWDGTSPAVFSPAMAELVRLARV